MNMISWAIVSLPLAWLWFRVISSLWPEWNINPQYSYGLVVPLLMVGLLVRRWHQARGTLGVSVGGKSSLLKWFCVLMALLYLPTRLINAGTPEWRPIQWLLALEAVGLTLYGIYLAGGKSWVRQAAFPVTFFLVAVPWPTPIEQPIIQGLSHLNAMLVVEVMGILNFPAVQHGSMIEVSTGIVDISDACSGIRSIQSSLMISLFLGEFFRFTWRRRLLLVPIGFVLAMGFNLGRASLLTWIAATKGVAAIDEYHDEAGFTIMLACTAGLWLVAWLLGRGNPQPSPSETKAADDNILGWSNDSLWRRCKRFAMALCFWVALVEAGVGLWYHFREAQLKPSLQWTMHFLVDNPTFKELPQTKVEHDLLQYDQGQKVQWQEDDGTTWQVFYYNWLPGRVAGYLAKRHTPEACLTATGLKMTAGPDLQIMNVHGVELPMRCYTFDTFSGPLQVFQCRWDAGAGKGSYTAQDLTRYNLLRSVWEGRGNQGQKVVEVIITGYADQAAARQALERQLDNLIKVEPAVGGKKPKN